MKTMQEEWRTYRDAVYPQQISFTQTKECHQAFFAGALMVLKAMHELAELPDADAEAALGKLRAEVHGVCKGAGGDGLRL